MKNFNSFVGYAGIISVLLMGCEPENLSPEEVSSVSELHMESSAEDVAIREASNLTCTTVSANEWPGGRVPGDFTEGVTITTSDPNAYVRTHQMADWLNCYDLTKSLSTSFDGPSYIFSFEEDVVSFSVRVIGVSFQMDNIYVTAYDDVNGAGDEIKTIIHYSVASVVCSEISVEGSGIRSIVVSSDGEVTNSVNIGGFSFCTNPDLDGDGINDDVDNCPQAANSDQDDFDGDGIGDVCDPDNDNDGIADVEDTVPFSNRESLVTVSNCNSGVENQQLSASGLFMSDLIDELETGEYKNLGQAVRSYNDLMNDWVQKGLISGDQKSLILSCAISEN